MTHDAPLTRADPDSSDPHPEDAGEEAMMFYAAILGRRPTLDPEAPDVLPHLDETEPPTAGGWAGDISRSVREELGKALHLKLKRRPTWAELMGAVTDTAGRRLDVARRRISGGRDKAA